VSDHACLSVQHVQPPIGHLCHCIIALFQAVSQQKPLKHLYIRAFRLYANGMHGILPGSAHTHSRLQAWQDNQLLSSHYSRKVQSAPTTYQLCTNGRGGHFIQVLEAQPALPMATQLNWFANCVKALALATQRVCECGRCSPLTGRP